MPQHEPLPILDGASFILDAPDHPPTLWGEGESVLWAEGEALMLVGPTGAGKTTLAQQLILARAGVRGEELLGFPVARDTRPVLYVAADRPTQAIRSFQRMVSESDRERLTRGLRVWRGPLPFDIGRQPHRLVDMAAYCKVGTVVLDSLKDVAQDLSKEESGGRVNSAIQSLLAARVQVLVLHHQRKAQAQNTRPRSISDVYGSTWLTAGAGSVVLLWGDPGDPVVELAHLKQPLGEVGPFELVHDHAKGRTSLVDAPDLAAYLRAAREGLTAKDAAAYLFRGGESRNHVEKARRRLEALVACGVATKQPGDSPKEPVRYRYSTPALQLVSDPSRGLSRA